MSRREWVLILAMTVIAVLGHSRTVAEVYACHVLNVPVCGGAP